MDINRIKEWWGKVEQGNFSSINAGRIDWLIKEHDRLTSDLTSAKEEIKAKEQSFRLCFDHGGSPGPAPDYCPKCIASERKETERLREALRWIAEEGDFTAPEGMKQVAKAALQSRQGEE